MKILLYGNQDDCSEMVKEHVQLKENDVITCDDDEELLLYMKEDIKLAIVLLDGADGMEGVITVRRQRPEIPVIWFSNDKGFAVQSYRLHTAYFHEKPVTPQILNRAFTSCQLG